MELAVLAMPREQEMVTLGKSEFLRPRVQFSQCLQARVVERGIPPSGRCLGPSNRQAPLVE
jgi:hypothetical protein